MFNSKIAKKKIGNNNIIYLDYISALYGTTNSTNSFGAILNHSLQKYDGKYSRYLAEKEIYRKIDKIYEILKISARVNIYSNRFTKEVKEEIEKIHLKALYVKKN